MEVEGDKSAAMPLLAVNGAAFSPLVFDADGAIRYSMQLRTYKMGMIPMPEPASDDPPNNLPPFSEYQSHSK